MELSGIELQKLKLDLQKSKQQNWQLAQANSHMLAVDSLTLSFVVEMIRFFNYAYVSL